LPYSPELITKLLVEHESAQSELERLLLTAVKAGQALSDPRAKEYMLHGAARRLGLIRRCLKTIFDLFPPAATHPIDSDSLSEVQISLHAFVMNLYGLFENLAWAFVLRHNLEGEIGERKKIGMFLRSTQRFLPPKLSSYLTSTTMAAWHTDYLKNYRDALAHRIPLYIPPAIFTPEEGERYAALEQREMECILAQQWEELERVRNERSGLGSACPMFLHAFPDEHQTQPVYLHPQMICDVKTILEFGPLYFAHWHERA
jgi:hypothetical protein